MTLEELLALIGEKLQFIGNSIIDFVVGIGDFFASFYDLLTTFASFVFSILGFIFYAGKTLITGIGKLFGYITGVAEWSQVAYTLGRLSTYIGPWGVIFMASLLLIIIIRILYGFIHNIIFHPHYKMSKSRDWEPTDIVDDRTYPRLPG